MYFRDCFSDRRRGANVSMLSTVAVGVSGESADEALADLQRVLDRLVRAGEIELGADDRYRAV